MVAVLACTVAAYGQSMIVYTLETGGDNHATDWESYANPMPAYSSGVTDGTTVVEAGDDLNWAVRVTVGGTHTGQPGDGLAPLGAANLVFDLAVVDSNGAAVSLGAAPMSCDGGVVPGTGGATNCVTTGGGFHSTINDGDSDGIRGGVAQDTWANAAFAIALYNQATPPAQQVSLIDEIPGPGFDYGWYPTANGRGGVDLDGTKPVNTSVSNPALNGKLVGFGAGYKNYNSTSYLPGVGLYEVEWEGQLGFGANVGFDPLNPTANERPVFEGQINTAGLAPGTYYLKVIPSENGNNILHGYVVWNSPTGDYNGFGSFAAKANSAVVLPAQANGVKFVVGAPPEETTVTARKIFYNNCYYDGNNVAINAVPGVGTNDDDLDAIDTSKQPLLTGGGQSSFANYTGYEKGINGLIYEFDIAAGDSDPQASNFVFQSIGKAGATAPVTVNPLASQLTVLQASGPRKVRMTFTFQDATVVNTWLQVTIGTGFGLDAADVHYWGNAQAEVNAGNSTPTNYMVTVADELAIRAAKTGIGKRELVTYAYDVNKSSKCDIADQLYCRSKKTPLSTNAVKAITR
jgi:hypothetical protein